MPKTVVYIRFPKTGLGNMLLVWARGAVFANLNNLPYYTSSWWGVRWGALLRRERNKRYYAGYFKETSFLKRVWLSYGFQPGKVYAEPPVQGMIRDVIEKKTLFVFNRVITDNDLFVSLRDHKNLIQKELYKILTPGVNKILQKSAAPVIGIHIRRGDFKIANPITPNEFFIKGIQLARAAAGSNLPVTVFTDAAKIEIEDILALPAVILAEQNPDIVDILLLSKSKIIFLSQSSTFSYWGAFLSEAVVVMPADDWQRKIRNQDSRTDYREVRWCYKDEDSTKELKKELLKVEIT
jgi:hypothetical protein